MGLETWLQIIVLLTACVSFFALIVLPLFLMIRHELQTSLAARRRRTNASTTDSGTIKVFNRISKLFAKIAAISVLSLLITQFSVVLLRYVFSIGSIALQESVLYFHAMIFMFGASLGLVENTHVRLDIIYRKLKSTGKAMIDLVGGVFFLAPLAVTVLFTGYFYVERAWTTTESSIEVSGLKYVYLLKTVILIFAVLLILQSINRIRCNLAILLKRNEKHVDDHC